MELLKQIQKIASALEDSVSILKMLNTKVEELEEKIGKQDQVLSALELTFDAREELCNRIQRLEDDLDSLTEMADKFVQHDALYKEIEKFIIKNLKENGSITRGIKESSPFSKKM